VQGVAMVVAEKAVASAVGREAWVQKVGTVGKVGLVEVVREEQGPRVCKTRRFSWGNGRNQ